MNLKFYAAPLFKKPCIVGLFVGFKGIDLDCVCIAFNLLSSARFFSVKCSQYSVNLYINNGTKTIVDKKSNALLQVFARTRSLLSLPNFL